MLSTVRNRTEVAKELGQVSPNVFSSMILDT